MMRSRRRTENTPTSNNRKVIMAEDDVIVHSEIIKPHEQLTSDEEKSATNDEQEYVPISGESHSAKNRQKRKKGFSKATNRAKGSVMRRFLIEEFGKDLLKSGSGVLDVAGGQSELAFQLVNLLGIPCTVIDPRPYECKRHVKRYQLGFLHRSARPSEELLPKKDAIEDIRRPHHFRLFFEDPLWSAFDNGEDDGERYFTRAKQRAEQVSYTVQGLREEAGIGYWERKKKNPKVLSKKESKRAVLRLRQEGKRERKRQDGAEGESNYINDGEGAGQEKVPKYVEQPDVVPNIESLFGEGSWDGEEAEEKASEDVQMKAIAGGAEDGASTNDGQLDYSATRREHVSQEVEKGDRLLKEGEDGDGGETQKGKETEEVHYMDDSVSWGNVRDVVQNCSLIVGLHPDQATDTILRFALSTGKPFAIVPCCVYSKDFPHRRLEDGSRVKSYESLVRYILEIGEKSGAPMQMKTLEFGGRNQVIYSRGRRSKEKCSGELSR